MRGEIDGGRLEREREGGKGARGRTWEVRYSSCSCTFRCTRSRKFLKVLLGTVPQPFLPAVSHWAEPKTTTVSGSHKVTWSTRSWRAARLYIEHERVRGEAPRRRERGTYAAQLEVPQAQPSGVARELGGPNGERGQLLQVGPELVEVGHLERRPEGNVQLHLRAVIVLLLAPLDSMVAHPVAISLLEAAPGSLVELPHILGELVELPAAPPVGPRYPPEGVALQMDVVELELWRARGWRHLGILRGGFTVAPFARVDEWRSEPLRR